MPAINMRRSQLQGIRHCEHAGLLIDRGFEVDRGDKLHNDDKMDLFTKAKNVPCPSVYEQAYKNWRQTHIENLENSRVWFGKLENRMYLGMGVASPLEAGITLHHTYGVPFIPGSAIKGVLSHYADDIGVPEPIKNIIFGEDASTDNKQDSGAAGCLIFNDAWWIPKGKALAPEMITVHAPKYYADKGKKEFIHPDFETPNPNPQIAIQGSFLFSIEGDTKWVEYAIKLLEKTLVDSGIGGKSASGYGYFAESKRPCTAFLKDRQLYKKQKEKDGLIDVYNNLPDHKKLIKDFEIMIEEAPEASTIIKAAYGGWVGKATEFSEKFIKFSNDYSDADKELIKSLYRGYYKKIGWYPSGLKPKQRINPQNKKEALIDNLFMEE